MKFLITLLILSTTSSFAIKRAQYSSIDNDGCMIDYNNDNIISTIDIQLFQAGSYAKFKLKANRGREVNEALQLYVLQGKYYIDNSSNPTYANIDLLGNRPFYAAVSAAVTTDLIAKEYYTKKLRAFKGCQSVVIKVKKHVMAIRQPHNGQTLRFDHFNLQKNPQYISKNKFSTYLEEQKTHLNNLLNNRSSNQDKFSASCYFTGSCIEFNKDNFSMTKFTYKTLSEAKNICEIQYKGTLVPQISLSHMLNKSSNEYFFHLADIFYHCLE